MILGGCQKEDNITTGIIGHVKYGKGDCFSPIDLSTKKYSGYNGKIYFFDKDKWDNVGEGSYDVFFTKFRKSSICTNVKKGKLSMSLPAGTYYVMPDEDYSWTEGNTITITTGNVLKIDFKFFLCTSW